MRTTIRRSCTGLALAALVLAALLANATHAFAQEPVRQPSAAAAVLRHGELIDYEAVLYSQSRLIDEVMATVAPSDATEASTYFLGFSAWAEQDVFVREAAQARDVADERLGTRGRSLLLVNHAMAIEEVPLASVSNLEIVLGRLGRLMNPAKDTLILFITTHGIENVLGVQFKPFPLNHLTPTRLAEMLDRSGIENRVIIISACHSGSFVPALRRPASVVMTAARGDRASFGCDNANDWTFFGNALFNHALRETTSLPRAFAQAAKIIEGWEAKEKFTPSLPQLFVGAGAGPMLERLARGARPNAGLLEGSGNSSGPD